MRSMAPHLSMYHAAACKAVRPKAPYLHDDRLTPSQICRKIFTAMMQSATCGYSEALPKKKDKLGLLTVLAYVTDGG